MTEEKNKDGQPNDVPLFSFPSFKTEEESERYMNGAAERMEKEERVRRGLPEEPTPDELMAKLFDAESVFSMAKDSLEEAAQRILKPYLAKGITDPSELLQCVQDDYGSDQDSDVRCSVEQALGEVFARIAENRKAIGGRGPLTLQDLNRFCASEDDARRHHLSAPFSQGAGTYATDGAMVIQVAVFPEAQPGVPDLHPDLPKLMQIHDEVTAWWPLEQAESLGARPCEECNGEGRTLHECDICDGGWRDCVMCKGAGEEEHFATPMGVLSRRYLLAMARAENTQIGILRTYEKHGLIPFRGDHFCGVVMPVKDDAEPQCRTLHAAVLQDPAA